VHRDEPTFEPRRYWRGPVWPQLAYLLWCAGAIAPAPTVRGAEASGLAELWHPETGAGLGAIPQSWSGLALRMAAPATPGSL
jgi:glycogen debranching enzyme